MSPPTARLGEIEPVELTLDIDGLGFIIYAPSSAAHLRVGEDYFTAHFMTEPDVQRHVQAGTITVCATGSPGTFHLTVRPGYPTADEVGAADFALRLAVRSDGWLVFRDVYDLIEWSPDAPAGQSISVAPGIHHVTLLSDRPPSGVLGDRQRVTVHLHPLDELPPLAATGIPTLSPVDGGTR